MIVREVLPEEKNEYEALINHPLQSWAWGEFRKLNGKKVIRLGVFDPEGEKKLLAAYQITVHPIPQTDYTVLYFPRGPLPDKTMIEALLKLGKQEKAIFVKMDPDVSLPVNQGISLTAHQEIHDFLIKNGCQKTRPFWFEYTSLINLKKSDEALLKNMHPKTRYNLRLAQRHGVSVKEGNSDQAFENYLRLMTETTKRQRFYAHTPEYHRQMWSVLKPAKISHLLLAEHQKRILAAWMFFVYKKTIYYPYGGSTRENKNVMAAYALLWEGIKLGQKSGCQAFDLWGCLGPNPDPKDSWLGFHRFKSGFGGQMMKYLGTYDLIINHQLYPLYKLVDKARWGYLKIRSRLSF